MYFYSRPHWTREVLQDCRVSTIGYLTSASVRAYTANPTLHYFSLALHLPRCNTIPFIPSNNPSAWPVDHQTHLRLCPVARAMALETPGWQTIRHADGQADGQANSAVVRRLALE